MDTRSLWPAGLLAFAAIAPAATAQFGGFATSDTAFRDLFINEATVNMTGTYVNFNGIAGTRFTSLASAPGATFESNITTVGTPTNGLPVYASTFSDRLGTIVGTPFSSGTDDGRMGYQVLFSSPQQYAGIYRNWNSSNVTQFYNSSDELLYEFSGLSVYYAGYTGDPNNQSTWVSRIQMDGNLLSGVRQVGYSDDLVYGVSESFAVPEPSTYALFGIGLAAVVLAGYRRKRIW